MKKHYKEDALIKQLETVPNVSLACEKLGISRNTVYRWCKEDSEFKFRLEEALECGTDSINDLAESKLVSHINNGSMTAIKYWLDNHKKEYMRPRPKDFWEREQSIPVAVIQIGSASDRPDLFESN
jgi:hypothetical protein